MGLKGFLIIPVRPQHDGLKILLIINGKLHGLQVIIIGMPYQAHWNPPVKKRAREAEPGGVKRRARGKQPPQNPQDSVACAEPVASPTPPTPSSLAGAMQDCSRSGSSCKNSTSSSSSSSSNASNDDENEPQPQKKPAAKPQEATASRPAQNAGDNQATQAQSSNGAECCELTDSWIRTIIQVILQQFILLAKNICPCVDRRPPKPKILSSRFHRAGWPFYTYASECRAFQLEDEPTHPTNWQA